MPHRLHYTTSRPWIWLGSVKKCENICNSFYSSQGVVRYVSCSVYYLIAATTSLLSCESAGSADVCVWSSSAWSDTELWDADVVGCAFLAVGFRSCFRGPVCVSWAVDSPADDVKFSCTCMWYLYVFSVLTTDPGPHTPAALSSLSTDPGPHTHFWGLTHFIPQFDSA